MKKILIDNRWRGFGGIGTFAEETNKINHYRNADFLGKPVNPLDCLKLCKKTLFVKDSVFFFPGYIPPLFSKAPYVFTIHDLNHIDRSENSSFFKRLFYKAVILRGCKQAKLIFTVSEFSRNRIIQWSGVSEDKVINVGNGVSENFTPEGDAIGYPFEYFLCVSNRKIHKNELGTLEAFKISQLPDSIKLVFTGQVNEELNAKIIELDLQDRVIFTGFVKQNDLPKLYRGAKALVFVSFYEGFGLPVLEAMASGVPVITSTTTSLGEVAGDAALLVEPTDIYEISLAMYKVNSDNLLRQKLIQMGFSQAKKYSWHLTAQKIRSSLGTII
ncbi:MAG: glycosyltransferase family 1 protein [Rouxiella aceris]|uniref:glycosyltransferase family 4 protein n=1 Tax=Rouxiella aceris TaxID=2703884 RepID=UPI002851E47C|nr:glycosyltransferase family 1 protein [Rouxiella aceris]MDR3434534.1 glycosyltransferase family 1 protein [Rouxiella aceris]